jgi:hypothetical protein
LVLVAVGATAVTVRAPTATPQVVNMTAVGVTVRASPLAMFLAGALSVLLLGLGLGLALVSQGTRRKARARKTLRRLCKDQAATPEVSADAGENSSRRDGLRDGNGRDTTRAAAMTTARSCRPSRTQTRTQAALFALTDARPGTRHLRHRHASSSPWVLRLMASRSPPPSPRSGLRPGCGDTRAQRSAAPATTSRPGMADASSTCASGDGLPPPLSRTCATNPAWEPARSRFGPDRG